MCSTDPDNIYDAIRATIAGFAGSYHAAINEKNATKLSMYLTPGCIRIMRPKSFVDILGLESDTMTVKQYEEIVATELLALETGHISVGNMIVDTKAKMASAEVTFHATWKSGRTDQLEFVFTFEFDGDCDKIKAITQFADTEKLKDVIAHIQATLASGQ
jgi:hypothetical protein